MMPHMILNIGDIQSINYPSEEQVGHFLQFMPALSPFIILSTADDQFLQATSAGDSYRVELREGKLRRYTNIPLDRAAQLFQAFRVGDNSIIQTVVWHRLSMLNDPYDARVWLVVLLVLIASCAVWFCMR